MDLRYDDLGDGIYCIDTGLYRHGLAACYLVREGDHAAVVDTGTTHTVPLILELLEKLGLSATQVDYVIPTHVHLDHAGGAGDLMARCPQARLVIHPKGAPHMIDPEKLVNGATAVYGEEAFNRDFGGLTPVPEERVIVAEDGMELDLRGRRLTFIDTPGHANHHGCILDSRSHAFFTGDTFGISYREFDTADGPWLFAPTTPVAFDPRAWQASLDKIMAYRPRAVYLTHYGRLSHPERHVTELRESIQGMAEVALTEEAHSESGRSARLQGAVESVLTGLARDHGCSLDPARIRELLAVDVALNAQGLEVWLARRARAAANPKPS
jgi:glyoxylase-like metal-dependent hydrolase (beta-lactamase superfamily II)